MASEWIGRPEPTDERVDRTPVAIYEGVLTLIEVNADIVLVPDVDREVVVAAIVEPPQWQPFVWPSYTPETDDDLRRFALMKLLTLFEFASRLGGDTEDDIRAALLGRLPEIDRLLARGEDISRYKRFPIKATIYHDGYFSGEFDHPGDGVAFPLGDDLSDTLDLYIKNMIRADMRRRIGFGLDPLTVDL